VRVGVGSRCRGCRRVGCVHSNVDRRRCATMPRWWLRRCARRLPTPSPTTNLLAHLVVQRLPRFLLFSSDGLVSSMCRHPLRSPCTWELTSTAGPRIPPGMTPEFPEAWSSVGRAVRRQFTTIRSRRRRGTSRLITAASLIVATRPLGMGQHWGRQTRSISNAVQWGLGGAIRRRRRYVPVPYSPGIL